MWAPDLLRIKQLEEHTSALRNSVICAFNQLLDLKDLNTGVHSTRLAEWAIRVARKLGIPETDLYQVEVAALLHDIGKIGIPDSILKKEGKLTDAERALMNKHPEYSWSILRLLPGRACWRVAERSSTPSWFKPLWRSPKKKPPTSLPQPASLRPP